MDQTLRLPSPPRESLAKLSVEDISRLKVQAKLGTHPVLALENSPAHKMLKNSPANKNGSNDITDPEPVLLSSICVSE